MGFGVVNINQTNFCLDFGGQYTTLDTYSHLSEGIAAKAAESIDGLFSKKDNLSKVEEQE